MNCRAFQCAAPEMASARVVTEIRIALLAVSDTSVHVPLDSAGSVFHLVLLFLSLKMVVLLDFHHVCDHSFKLRVALRLLAVNLIGMKQRNGILHGDEKPSR